MLIPAVQEYVMAPLAVKVAVCPEQMAEEDDAMPTVGVGVTVIVTVLTALLQEPLEPVMLYTVVAAGLNTLEVPEPDGDQV